MVIYIVQLHAKNIAKSNNNKKERMLKLSEEIKFYQKAVFNKISVYMMAKKYI